jgi:hypothetical protein
VRFWLNLVLHTCSRYNQSMTIKELENAVSQLSPDELAAFRGWFAKFDAAQWDQQSEGDVASGRLDILADEAAFIGKRRPL